ncbi:MAG: NAD-dependent epimerase/dehydratase family protein [Chloroflexi bacterium]|nr:MAG: NAD-dependent epimerase/dehydratase family protein [Chloroflexota bacterium]TMG65945.1 MAG: NAD-dependent epimerase/dehydratase family protein [Chloroflexota bacterium]
MQDQPTKFDVVTGAFSFTGRFIARRLLAQERRIKTLTNHARRPGTEDITAEVAPLQFTDRDALVESLRGADVLYNTYWVRFQHGRVHFGEAVANTRILLGAARDAGVRKVVHVSVSNPSEDSPLDYFAGKARTERAVRESGLAWAIIRPTLVFGQGDILINNIAWLLRRLPIFGVPGRGDYRLQPVAGEDVAEIATWAAEQTDNVIVDAAGPDTVYYSEMVESIAIAVGRHPRFVYLSPRMSLLAARVIGRAMKDVMLNEPELEGLMQELLVSHERPRGTQRLDNWLLSNAETIGRVYASELERHWR